MKEPSKNKLKDIVGELNTSLVLYYNNVPSTTAKDTIMMNGKPVSSSYLLQYFQSKMDDVRTSLDGLLLILKEEE